MQGGMDRREMSCVSRRWYGGDEVLRLQSACGRRYARQT
jgi:hypothetical protein